MRIVILAAGYATRLYPLTLTRPKPLLTVADRPMLDHVLQNVSPIEDITHVYIVSNTRFADQFRDWARARAGQMPKAEFKVIDDGSTNVSSRLGAIGDLALVLKEEAVEDDVLVVAGDNLFNKPLGDFGRFCREKQAPVVGIYDVQSTDQARKYGVISTDKQGRISKFEEKPENPASTFIGIALYYYPKSALPLIHQYVAEGNNLDQPGRLVQWMYPKTPFYAWEVPGVWYDIGSKESLEEANRLFS